MNQVVCIVRKAVRLLLATWLSFCWQHAQSAEQNLVEAGRRIYQDGILVSGAPLKGVRDATGDVVGRDAACERCHRRSGMGAVEGEFLVAPITANYLFLPASESGRATMDQRRGKSFNLAHSAYDESSLSRAIREGRNADGRNLSDLMPRYELDEQDYFALSAYLRSLNRQWSPGMDGDRVRFATIITPDVDGQRRAVFVDMLRAVVRQKNASTVPGTQRGGRRHMTSAAELVLGTERKWELEIWELTGEPPTWQAQLEDRQAKRPVFAVLSGLGDGTWAPVHKFCEVNGIPCWFPIVSVPELTSDDFYSLYFSAGILLEADVLAHHLHTSGLVTGKRIVQVVDGTFVAQAAANRLSKRMLDQGSVQVSASRIVDATANAPKIVAEQVEKCDPGDIIIVWVGVGALQSLGQAVSSPRCSRIYFSAELLRGVQGVPRSWRGKSEIIFPYEMPQRRVLNLHYLHQWMRQNHIPLVDEAMQSKLYFAANFMSDTMAELLDNLYRDYLLERAESMIGRREGGRSEEEDHARQMQRRAAVKARMAGGAPLQDDGSADPLTMGLRQSTTVFPRLSLGPGQRFASKGARLVKFIDSVSDTIVEASDWITP